MTALWASAATVPELLAHRAAATPEGQAFVAVGVGVASSSLSWQQFADQAARMAGALYTAGLRHGDRIAVLIPASIEWELLHHAVLSRMAARGKGRVVNIASDAARVGSSGESVYAFCKGGLVAFSKTIARELARQKINVNVVCPGPTDTALFRDFAGEGEQGEKLRAALIKAIPFGRLGEPEDVAGIVVFLSSDEAAFITGQVISVSGGLTMAG